MDDLISRAAVVDAIDGVDWYHQNQHGEMVHGANPDEHQAWYKAEDIYKAVESVPSAQRERLADAEQRILHQGITGGKDGAEKVGCKLPGTPRDARKAGGS